MLPCGSSFAFGSGSSSGLRERRGLGDALLGYLPGGRPHGQGRSRAHGFQPRRASTLSRPAGGRVRLGAAGLSQGRRPTRQADVEALGRAAPAARARVAAEGFFVPIRQWFRGDFLNQLAALLPWNRAIRRWFRPDGVAALVREQQAGGNASRAIWGLMQIAIWHRIFVEGHSPGRDEDPLDWIA